MSYGASAGGLPGSQDFSWTSVGPRFREAMGMLVEAHREDMQRIVKSTVDRVASNPELKDFDDSKHMRTPHAEGNIAANDTACQVTAGAPKKELEASVDRYPPQGKQSASLLRTVEWPDCPEEIVGLNRRLAAENQRYAEENLRLAAQLEELTRISRAAEQEAVAMPQAEKSSVTSLAVVGPLDSSLVVNRASELANQPFVDDQIPSLSLVQVNTKLSDESSKSAESGGERRAQNSEVIASLDSLRQRLGAEVPVDVVKYDVSQYYHTEGMAQTIATNDSFGHFTLLVIGINAVYMGFDADFNDADSLNEADWVFILFENIFCLFFVFEWAVRFCAFDGKINCLRDGWFKFDSFLLAIIIFETWVMTVIVAMMDGGSFTFSSGPLRLLRLLRLARLVRIMRAFPELLTMVHGMVVAMRAVGSAMILLIMALYAWGITMHLFLKDDERLFVYWGTVSRSMLTLLANGALGDSIGHVMRDLYQDQPVALLALLAFVVFAALTILNMLVGVLCEVVSEVAKIEKDEHALSKLKDTVHVMLMHIDQDGGGTITQDELTGMLGDEHALKVMRDLNINVHHFLAMTEMYFEDSEDMSIPWIMQLLVDNQGGRPTTVEDMCNFNTFQSWERKHDNAREFRKADNARESLRVDLKAIKSEIAALTDLVQLGVSGQQLPSPSDLTTIRSLSRPGSTEHICI